MKARRNRPLLLIDLSVPRNIDPNCDRTRSRFSINIDDLEAVARRGVQARERELTACHQIIEAHVAALNEKLLTEEAQSPGDRRHTAFNHRSYSTTIVAEINDGCRLSCDCFWFCWCVCWSGSLSIRQDAAGCSLHQLLHHGFTDYSRSLVMVSLW